MSHIDETMDYPHKRIRKLRDEVEDFRKKCEEHRATITVLFEALAWCGGHSYGGGKTFAQTDPVKRALEMGNKFR